MLNIDVGGIKGRRKLSPVVRKRWSTLDVVKKAEFGHDLTSGSPFPFQNNSVDNYYTSHTLEHVSPKELGYVFSELYRTLKLGGLIRIVVPDVEKAIEWYYNKDPNLFKKGPTVPRRYPPTRLGRLFSWVCSPGKYGHKMGFDLETLYYYLQQAGFVNIRQLKYEECSNIFKGKDFPRYRNFSLYVEATKK